MNDKSSVRIWNNKLYNLQLEAPDPIPIKCERKPAGCPPYYGSYYHGKISRDDVSSIMKDRSTGSFLIRECSSNQPDTFALVIKYRDEIKTFLVYYDVVKSQHYVGEKLFDTIELLVKDGLIHFHIEYEGADVLDEIANATIYEFTPYRLRYQLVKPANRRQSIAIDTKNDAEVNPHRPIRSPLGQNRRSYSSNNNSSDLNLPKRSTAEDFKNGNHITSPSNVKHNDALAILQSRYAIPAPCIPQFIGDDTDKSSNSSEPSPRLLPPLPKPKSHSFKIHTFIGAHWCDFCNNFLWGLKSQGMRCVDCGFQAHKKCSERSLADCLPDMKYMRRVFAVDLISLVRAENRTIPIVLEKCVTEIEKRGGQYTEGIYRIPGNQDNVEELKRIFDKNAEIVDLSIDSRLNDLNVLTSLIKLFMRQLPNPMVPYENYEDFLRIAKLENLSDEIKDIKYRDVIHQLPLEHYNTLKFFIGHINRISKNSAVNMMTTENLSIVLAPSLITSSYTDPKIILSNSKLEQSVLERLISKFDFIFPDLETAIN